MRLLLIFFAVLILALAIRNLLIKPGSGKTRRTPREGEESLEKIVPCKFCGLHLPESEAVKSDGEIFCCREHAEQWRALNKP